MAGNRSTYRPRAPEAYRRRRVAIQMEADIVGEMRAEARRLGRSLSYVAQLAYRIAKDELRRIPPPPGGGRRNRKRVKL